MNFSITKVQNGFTVTTPGKKAPPCYDSWGNQLPASASMHVFTDEATLFAHLTEQFKGN